MARGPAYPFVNLQEAVDFAKKMYSYSRRSPADANSVIQEGWGYSPASSSGKKILAALGYFGLTESDSSSGGRKVKLTERAYRILIDDVNSPERKQALRDAALSPKAYLLCWTRWGTDMPPSMRSTLIFNEGFVESTVDGFLADYKKTIEYAGLLDDSEMSASISEEPEPEMVESQQVTDRQNVPAHPAVMPSSDRANPQIAANPSADDRSDVFSLDEGPVRLSWPKTLSSESFQDLSDWLELMKRKIQRSVTSQN